MSNSYMQSKYKEALERDKLKLSIKGNSNVQADFSFPRQVFNNHYREFYGNYRIVKVIHVYNGVSYIINIEAIKIDN